MESHTATRCAYVRCGLVPLENKQTHSLTWLIDFVLGGQNILSLGLC